MAYISDLLWDLENEMNNELDAIRKEILMADVAELADDWDSIEDEEAEEKQKEKE